MLFFFSLSLSFFTEIWGHNISTRPYTETGRTIKRSITVAVVCLKAQRQNFIHTVPPLAHTYDSAAQHLLFKINEMSKNKKESKKGKSVS